MEFLNTVDIVGIVDEIEQDYTYINKKTNIEEKFFKIMLKVPRLSGNFDVVPFDATEKMVAGITSGDKIAITGSLRTRNYIDDNKKTHVKIYGYADDVVPIDDETYDDVDNKNCVRMTGIVCKPPVYRQTKSGRIITDLTIAVNRQCYRKNAISKEAKTIRKSYYFPCLTWGPTAKAAKNLQVGDAISFEGRFQSRKFYRKSDATNQEHIAYEISILDYKNVETENR